MSAQEPAADHCPARPGEPHHIVARCGARVYVKLCSLCGWVDLADLDEQARRFTAEGHDQAIAELGIEVP